MVVLVVLYLDQRSLRLKDLDDHHHGDADHGCQGQRPAQANGPIGVLVHLVIRQRLVLRQGEHKATLGDKNKIKHSISKGNISPFLVIFQIQSWGVNSQSMSNIVLLLVPSGNAKCIALKHPCYSETRLFISYRAEDGSDDRPAPFHP